MAAPSKMSLSRITFFALLIVSILYVLCTYLGYIRPFVEQESSVSSRDNFPQTQKLDLDLLEWINIVGTAPVAHVPPFPRNSSNWEVIGFLEEFKARRVKFLNSSQPLLLNENKTVSTSRTVHIATAACEERGTEEGIVLLKSALLFGQDTNIHAYVFTDSKSLVGLALDLLQLKWTSEVLGSKFHFTVLLKTFPNGWDGNTYGPCATQRLFFPSALPKVDAVLYLDVDTLILSNLTRIWLIFDEMNASTIAAVAPNTVGPMDKRVYYTPDIPIYGNRGLNTGVMLMNLTRMRSFQLEQRAIAIELLYKSKLWLADQDIFNIIFNISPDKLHMIDCSYNFYYNYCSSDSSDTCGREGSCFCEPTLKTGVKILHGVGRAFNTSGFMSQAFKVFQAMNLLTEDTSRVIEELATSFRELGQPCSNLSAEALYGNALEYLKGVK